MNICFDLDGTIYDLYNVPNWLHYFENEKTGIFTIGETLIDTVFLGKLCNMLHEQGHKTQIITWLPRDASKEYEKACTIEKMNWIKKHMPYIQTVSIVPYGTPKHKVAKRTKQMVLFDDNKEVRREWNTPFMRMSFDEKRIIPTLATFLTSFSN